MGLLFRRDQAAHEIGACSRMEIQVRGICSVLKPGSCCCDPVPVLHSSCEGPSCSPSPLHACLSSFIGCASHSLCAGAWIRETRRWPIWLASRRWKSGEPQRRSRQQQHQASPRDVARHPRTWRRMRTAAPSGRNPASKASPADKARAPTMARGKTRTTPGLTSPCLWERRRRSSCGTWPRC